MLFLGGLNGLDRFNMDDVVVFGRFWLASSLVRRLFRPSRSMHFGDVSETNGRETASKTFSDHVTRNASAAHNNEA